MYSRQVSFLVIIALCAPMLTSQHLAGRVNQSSSEYTTRVNKTTRVYSARNSARSRGINVTTKLSADKRRNITRVAPLGQRRYDPSDLELLCRLGLYEDMRLASQRKTKLEHIEAEDRLIFLIPLIIIYWHHRHPQFQTLLADLNSVVSELGDDSISQRRIIDKMIAKVDDKYSCLDLIQPVWLQDGENSKQFMKTVEALSSLRSLLDRSVFEGGDHLDRQVGARQIRGWFSNLLQHNLSHSAKKPAHSRTPTVTTESSVETSTIATTTEPYGWPHYENRTTTVATTTSRFPPWPHGQSESSWTVTVGTTAALLAATSATTTIHPSTEETTTEIQDSNVAITTTPSAGTEFALEPTPTIQTNDMAIVSERQPQQVAGDTHEVEFFNMVSSIMTDIDQMYNSTYFED